MDSVREEDMLADSDGDVVRLRIASSRCVVKTSGCPDSKSDGSWSWERSPRIRVLYLRHDAGSGLSRQLETIIQTQVIVAGSPCLERTPLASSMPLLDLPVKGDLQYWKAAREDIQRIDSYQRSAAACENSWRQLHSPKLLKGSIVWTSVSPTAKD